MKRSFLLAGIFVSVFFSHVNAQNFTLSQLQNPVGLSAPTTLQFGPDGRLYVGLDVGRIMAYTISKNGNTYTVTNAETIDLVLEIPNHNDNGNLNASESVRQVTGLLVTGTASNPVLYVTSSDPRIGGGGSGGDLNLDTNSGTISRLTWNGNSWEKVDLVRGLPRSEENHAPNGLQLDQSTNTLYCAVGGHTNAGGPSNNFAFTTEYALSAAIIKVDLNVINSLPVRGSGNDKYIYDLPTLDDPTRTNISNPDYNSSLAGSPQTIDQNDPFGGNDGRNQAKLIQGGPVQIYSPGYRNAYDIVITKAFGKQGRMYTVDNGANGGWGGYPKDFNSSNVTNEYQSSEPGSNASTPSGFPQVNNLDNLHLVSKPGMSPIYGGHPTPIRANPNGAGLYYHNGSSGTFSLSPTTDWPPVPPSMANPEEAYFLIPGTDDGALATFGSSTNGITEYLSQSYFSGEYVGNLFATDFNGGIWRFILNSEGTALTSLQQFASGFGANPLDITTQATGEIFDGSIWVADYGVGKIFIFTPNGEPSGGCTGNNESYNLDDDNDGYSNGDETLNGTNPCNNLSIPVDFDGDFLSDKLDTDDDNDGNPDTTDPFHHDATNGLNTPTTILYPFLNGNPGTGLFGLGFTGLMINNTGNPDNFYTPSDPGLIMGGAVGLASFPADDGKASSNLQRNGFQFGYHVPGTTQFSIQSSLVGPFFNGLAQTSLNANHRQGIYIGTGDQDNFLAIALSGATSGGTAGFRVFGESGGVSNFNTHIPVTGILSATNIYLYLDVNPVTKVVTAKYSTNASPTLVSLGSFTVTGALATKLQNAGAVAVGLIAYSGTTTKFSAKYDFMNIVTTAPAVVNPVVDQVIMLGTTSKVINIGNVFTDDGGAGNLTYTVTGNTSPSLITGATISGSNLTLTFASGAMGTGNIKIKATDNTAQFAEDEFNVVVTDNTAPTVLINAGGPALTQGGWSADQYFNGGNSYSAVDNITNTSNPALYQSERWGNMSYAIPVTNGTYTVKLHFAEIFHGSAGGRVFNVNVEGQANLNNYDIYAKTGNYTAIIETLTNINVTDGTLNITFTSVVDNATIAGIEVVPQSTANTPPGIANPIADQNALINSGTKVVSLANVFTDNGGVANLTYTVSGNTNTALITGTSITGTNLTLSIGAGQTGSSNIKVKATDAAGLFVEDEFKIDVTTTPPAATALINAGGGAVVFSGQTWAADNSFSGGISYSTTAAIAGTTNDAIYQSERFGNFTYSIPVTNGSYTVKLHFAEIFFEGANLRKFNVNVENGQGTLTNYDIFAAAGALTAKVEQFSSVAVSDGVLNISFTSVIDNAKVSAIEVISNGSTPPANTAPVVANAITDKSVNINTANLVVPLANVFSDNNGAANLTLTVSGNTNTALVTSAAISGTNLTLTFAAGQTGTANIKVKATDAGGLFVEDEFKVDVVNNTGTVTKLINSGGANVIFSGQTWGADNSFTGGSAYSITGAIAGTTNDAIYQSERYGNFSYSIPMTNGSYTVKLHFAEIYFDQSGQRIFNVNVENGQGTLTNYDIVSKAGSLTATTEQFVVNLTDGTLNITFTSVQDNAKVSAIEVISNSGGGNTAPLVANPITDKTVNVSTTSLVVGFANTFSDNGGVAALTFSITGNTNTALVTGASINGTNLTLTFATGVTGSALIKVRATDAGALFVEDEFKVDRTSTPIPNSILINSGGPAVTLSGQTWAADKNFSGGTPYSYSNPIAGTTNDVLYQTERFGTFSYAVPVTNGSYTVKLHFAETFFGAINARKFNVNVENNQGSLTNYDIYAQAGASTAKIEQFAINVSDGTLNITFTSVVDNAKVCAIEIISGSGSRLAKTEISFQAIPAADQVSLSWVLPSQDEQMIEIERSRDGLEFETLHSLSSFDRNARSGQSYADRVPVQGVSYYRIKTTTVTGHVNYSAIRSVVMGHNATAFLLYPNPNNTGVVFMEIPKVAGKENIAVRILNIQGAEMYRTLQAERNTQLLLKLQLPAGIAKGTYIVEVDQNGKKYHSRVIVN